MHHVQRPTDGANQSPESARREAGTRERHRHTPLPGARTRGRFLLCRQLSRLRRRLREEK